jgi:hypothetical protein
LALNPFSILNFQLAYAVSADKIDKACENVQNLYGNARFAHLQAIANFASALPQSKCHTSMGGQLIFSSSDGNLAVLHRY